MAGLRSKGEIHLIGTSSIVVEAGSELTLKSGAQFVKIDADGVTIKGSHVWINDGGAPGTGQGVGARSPEAPREAVVKAPGEPEPYIDPRLRSG